MCPRQPEAGARAQEEVWTSPRAKGSTLSPQVLVLMSQGFAHGTLILEASISMRAEKLEISNNENNIYVKSQSLWVRESFP